MTLKKIRKHNSIINHVINLTIMKATYFTNINSIEELKKCYKELALKHHPDRKGGDTATMQEINNEYKYFCEHPSFNFKHESDKDDLFVYPRSEERRAGKERPSR